MKKIFYSWFLVLVVSSFTYSYDKKLESFNKSKLDSRLVMFYEETIQKQQETSQPKHSRIISVGKNNLNENLYEVIVYTNSDNSIEEAFANGISSTSLNTISKEYYTARLSLIEISLISQLASTKFIEPPRNYKPKLNLSLVEMKTNLVHSGSINNTNYKGDGILIGIFDTGIDFTHDDFRLDSDATKTRIHSIWEQGALSGTKPTGFNYGAEYTKAQINDELDGTPTNIVKQIDSDGHGTHVASCAAGDGSSHTTTKYVGTAPNSEFIIVNGNNTSGGFSSSRMIDAITYIRQTAEAAGKPFVINLSLGGHDGPHDGTTAEEKKINEELAKPGRAIVVAAGNEGEDYIHHDSTIVSSSIVTEFTVYQYTPETGINNDFFLFSIWYPKQFSLNISVTTPKGTITTANHGLQATNQTSTNEGFVKISNAYGGPNPTNDVKECWIEVIDTDASKAPGVGVWKLTFSLASGSPANATYDAWIADFGNDDDMWVDFTKGGQRRKLVGMPGTSDKAITVGAYVTKWNWTSSNGNNYNYTGTSRVNNYALFSSPGPTRTGSQKPDVSAPGQAIAAALSKNYSAEAPYIVTGGKHVIEQGTSMAAPLVAGAVALMLQVKPTLTSDQIKNYLKNSSRTDSYTGTIWNAQWGFGKVDVNGAMLKALGVKKEKELIPTKMELMQNYPNPFNPITTIKFSVPEKNAIEVIVYDLLGNEVETLVKEVLDNGMYSINWNASKYSSGVYTYVLKQKNNYLAKKLILIK